MKKVAVGIDVGALFVKAVKIQGRDQITHRYCKHHRGNPGKGLEEALAAIGIEDGAPIGITGAGAKLFADTLGVPLLDISACQIEAVRRLMPEATYIMDIGGASATLISLDREGHFLGIATNSLCAAGTGSFLDEQAGRLGVSYEDMAGFESVEAPPAIATRCAVFAKSDLIHRQQEGCSKAAMWSGLCRGMTRTLLQTMLNGRPLDGPTAVIGGVAQNREVLRWLREAIPSHVRVLSEPALAAAFGAALRAVTPHKGARTIVSSAQPGDALALYDWPLTLERTVYPSFETEESFTDAEGTEVRLVAWPEAGGSVRGVLGVDIGSTSTKAALVDAGDRVVVDLYRKTGGDPIGATKRLFRALATLAEQRGVRLEIEGVGTTGSGRKLVGMVIGADAIVNEISAHVAGAVACDPSVDTIFEIGGQDSKYMHVVAGHIRNSNMNFVCAAGTGSFVEEQAHKLGYPVSAVGPAVLGERPPLTSDRCTVFMEQDVTALVQAGVRPEQALSGVMVSVVKNYLNKVVGNRYRSREKIFFQGATARNQGLVAAFERLLGVQMVVSPYCHVMGAFGVALLTRRAMAEQGLQRTKFRGLDLDQREVRIRYQRCALCQNDCQIAFAEVEGVAEQPSWGYLCGRDPDEQKVRINEHEKPLRLRQRLWREAGSGVEVAPDAPVVGLPQALSIYTYLPLWQRFLNELGFRIQLSGLTDEGVRELGTRITGAEFCFPAKVAMGHVARLAVGEGVDFVLVPHMVSEKQNAHTTGSKFCPYVQAWPSYSRAALALNGIEVARLLSPVVDLRSRESRVVDRLVEALAGPLGRNREQLAAAWRAGLAAQREFERRCAEEGQRILAAAREKGERLLVLVGRPYNNFDTGQNLGLPQKLAEQGRTVLPLDFLAHDPKRLGQRYRSIYWSYGQRILSALEQVAQDDLLDAVYLTNFNCGPDSFLLSFAEEIQGDRPFLTLELDEHGADAGYLTRIEAYFDVLRRPRGPQRIRRPHRNGQRWQDRIVWIPPMHPYGAATFAAVFRAAGFDARPLPPEDKAVFELGRSLTRGGECLPTALTIGALVQAVRDSGEPAHRHAFFMPTATGPCRFGLYVTLHRQILDRLRMNQVALLSPSSFNSYQGVPESLRRGMWQSMLLADQLFKVGCRVRPYELNPGETNRVIREERRKLEAVLETSGDIHAALRQSVSALAAVPRRQNRERPLVGVVGEIYVRCNTFANEDVISAIERFGGEAWLAPMSEWILYTTETQRIAFKDGSRNLVERLVAGIKNRYLYHQERMMFEAAGPLLDGRREPDIEEVLRIGERFLPIEFEGEAILTVGRAVLFALQGASMVVNCAPFGCMPGTLTTALFRKISGEIGIPIVNMFYDGSGAQNPKLEAFLHNAVRAPRPALSPLRLPAPPAEAPGEDRITKLSGS